MLTGVVVVLVFEFDPEYDASNVGKAFASEVESSYSFSKGARPGEWISYAVPSHKRSKKAPLRVLSALIEGKNMSNRKMNRSHRCILSTR